MIKHSMTRAPKVGIVPLESGLTNKDELSEDGERVVGLNTENSEINEGCCSSSGRAFSTDRSGSGERGSMCNLSQGIVEDTEERIIMNMCESNFTVEQIALATRKTVEEVQAIIESNQVVPI
jgi:hypothetical protein